MCVFFSLVLKVEATCVDVNAIAAIDLCKRLTTVYNYMIFRNPNAFVTMLIVAPIISMVGIVGNVFCFIALSNEKTSCHVILMKTLACADSLHLLFVFLYYFIEGLDSRVHVAPWFVDIINITNCGCIHGDVYSSLSSFQSKSALY
jgi:hypothetical protein